MPVFNKLPRKVVHINFCEDMSARVYAINTDFKLTNNQLQYLLESKLSFLTLESRQYCTTLNRKLIDKHGDDNIHP